MASCCEELSKLQRMSILNTQTLNHRITESQRMEETSEIESKLCLIPTIPFPGHTQCE